jgi:hypothetical protein
MAGPKELGPDGAAITDLDAVAPKPFVDAFFARFCSQVDNKVRGRLASRAAASHARARGCGL